MAPRHRSRRPVPVSHGDPGNRVLLPHLAANIAFKTHVVASIGRTDSAYRMQAAFASALVNRMPDQVIVLDGMARLNANATSSMAGTIDSTRTGLTGSSMDRSGGR